MTFITGMEKENMDMVDINISKVTTHIWQKVNKGL